MLRRMTTRELQIPESWKRRLLHLRVLSGTVSEPHLDEREVLALQRALGRPLGDGLLALLANGDERMMELDVRIGAILGHTKDVHAAGLGKGLIGLGKRSDHNILYGTTALGTFVHRLDVATGGTEQLPTEVWLDGLIASQQERLRDAKGTKRARAIRVLKDDEITAFAPAIVTNDDQLGRVTHTKFGPGDVLEERDGRVTVRFDDGSTRKLLRSFLTEL